MRWNQIINEEVSFIQTVKNATLDILSSLKAQGEDQITVDQVFQQLKNNPEIEGNQLDQGAINAALENVQNVKIAINPDDNKMTIFIDNPTAGRVPNKDQSEKDDKAIRSAAMRALDKKDAE